MNSSSLFSCSLPSEVSLLSSLLGSFGPSLPCLSCFSLQREFLSGFLYEHFSSAISASSFQSPYLVSTLPLPVSPRRYIVASMHLDCLLVLWTCNILAPSYLSSYLVFEHELHSWLKLHLADFWSWSPFAIGSRFFSSQVIHRPNESLIFATSTQIFRPY
jgi:hypothetical protein